MSISIATLALDVLEQQLSQQLRSSHYALPLGAVLRQFHPRLSRQFQQPVRISHYLPQKLPPRFAVRPVDYRGAASPLMLEPRYLWYPWASAHAGEGGVRHGRQDPQQFDDAVCQQIVGVLHRAPSQDVGRVQRHPHPTLFQVARLPRQAQTALEHLPHLLVQYQLRPEHLQRTLGKGSILNLNPQGDFPPDVEVSPRLGLGVAHPVVGLQAAAPWPAGWAARCPGHCPDSRSRRNRHR